MFVGDTQETVQKATGWIDSIANAISKVKGGTKQIKADIAAGVAKDVAPAAARATATAAVVGSAVMLGLVLLVMRKKRRQ